MKEFDTICGIATSLGEGGISIIRVSGDKALEITDKVFVGKNAQSIIDMKTYTMRYGHICEIGTKNIIDEVIISFMKGPKSFTAEDVVEVNCHGGIVSTNKVLEEIIKAGARLAEPGEYTKRAFLNGKMDLSKAEAVMDLIHAKSEYAYKNSLNQLSGGLKKKIKECREKVLYEIAFIESMIRPME